jgi:N-sulfoglucosamine sulfohydrolase
MHRAQLYRRVFFLLFSFQAVIPAADAGQPAKPNILFALADDWSYGHAGAYGCNWVKTPALDRVAREGILFTHAYTPNGKCAPSRASLLTGRNPWQLKAAANHWCYFPAEFKTFPEALGEQGYFTGMTGKGWAPGVAKNASGKDRQMTGRPFNKRQAPAPTADIARNDYAANFMDFLDAAPSDKPWCFWYGGFEPHRGYEFGSGVAKGGKRLSDIDRVPACWPDNEAVRNDMLDYAFEVEHFDRHLGRMLAELEKRGLLDNTLVVVTSDNGMPFPHDKGHAYNDSDHLPLAVMWKKGVNKPGRVVDDYVSFIDVAPTFLDVAGLECGKAGMAPVTGRSLTEIFKSEKAGRVVPERDHVLVGKERNDVGRPYDWGYPIRGIVKGDTLYLHNFEPSRWPGGNPEVGYLDTDGSPTKTEVLKSRLVPGQKHFWEVCFGMRPSDEIYDLRRDPSCVSNLVSTLPFDELKRELFDELKRQEDPRVTGRGAVFDTYPCASPRERGFYERFMRGEINTASWVNESDANVSPEFKVEK